LIFGIAIWRGFRLSHRIWGPVIPLRRQINDLKNGNYQARIQLRPGDEFVELAEDLNALAHSLEKSRPPAAGVQRLN
jgi:signal transduction histidine kinase